MTPNSPETCGPAGSLEPEWSRWRWGTVMLLVMAIQLAFLFALGDRQEVKSRHVPPVKVWRSESPFAGFIDPTLFALPSIHGVAGLTWLKTASFTNSPFRLASPPHLLALPEQKLGVAFSLSPATSAPALWALAAKPAPESFELLVDPAVLPPPQTNSTWRISGDLAPRRWLNAPTLGSWPGTNLLTPTKVQALVSKEGQVRSVTLLPPGSGSPTADEQALQLARMAQFAPDWNGPALVVGELIFRWHTVTPTP